MGEHLFIYSMCLEKKSRLPSPRPAVVAGSGGEMSGGGPVMGGALPAWAQGLQLTSLAALEERQGEAGGGLSTGLAALDRRLGGGLPRGALSELSGPVGSLGLTTLQHGLLRSAREAQLFAAFVDGFDRFDPGSCPAALREGLLWVRGDGRVPQVLKAADLLVRDPNFGLLLLDLREAAARELRRVPAQHWYRLQRAVRESGGTLALFTPFPLAPSATLRVRFRPTGSVEPAWELLRQPAAAAHADLPATQAV